MSKKIETAIATAITGSVITLTFANGEVLRADATNLSDTIRIAAMMHGLKQKLADAAAISRNPDTGASATVDDKFDAVREVFTRITSPDGTWNKVRGTGEGSAANTGLFIRAFMAVTGKDRAAADAAIKGLSDEQVKALKSNSRIVMKMAELKAAASNVDSDAVLDSLMSDADDEALM